jgi:DNA invertase Pin-like site-specific DNA recombinase
MIRGMLKAALYLRISKDSEKLGRGVARQRTECLNLLERRGGMTVVAEFEDNDISASSYSRKTRPGFKDLLDRTANGEFDVLVAWDLDRLIRRPEDGEKLITLNATSGVNLLTVHDSVDLTSPNGRLFLRIKVDVSAHESELKSVRIKAAHRQRLEEGKPISGRTPFGWERGGLIVNRAEATALREGVSALLAGESLHSIQRTWNRAGLLGPKGKPWSTTGIKNVLRRWRNAGILEHLGEPLDGVSQIEPIISREDLQAVRDRLTLRPDKTGRPVTVNWLAGVMKCGVCGADMFARKQFYQCRVSTEHTREATDTARHVSIAKHIAEDVIRTRLYYNANTAARWNPVEAAGVEKVRGIEDALTEAVRRRQATTELLFMEGVDRARVQKELTLLASTIHQLEKDRIEYRTATSEAARIGALMVGPTDSGMNFTEAWTAYFDTLTVEQKRDLARTLTVTVAKGGKGAKRVLIT